MVIQYRNAVGKRILKHKQGILTPWMSTEFVAES